MLLCVKRTCLVALVLSGLAAVLQVGAMRVYTSGELEAVNGTDVRLKCTFQSSSPINPSALTVSWNFRPLTPTGREPGREESVFFYQDKPYPPPDGRFRKRVLWAGDIMGRDASIIVREVKFTYNGTFSCQIKNPPDVHGNAGEIRLRVVTTASFSELLILALAIGAAIALVVILLVIILSCRKCRKNRQREEVTGEEEAPRRERKDPTACHPAMAVHLYMSQTSIEIDSSDGMISDPSTGDPSSEEEEGPSSDDEAGGGSD